VVLYLAWDFTDPDVPGVFTFDADQSIDAAQEKRIPEVTTASAITPAIPSRVSAARDRPPDRPPSMKRGDRVTPAPVRFVRRTPPPPAPSPASEDH